MIASLEDLKKLSDKKSCSDDSCKEELRVCIGSSCLSLGSDELKKELKK